MTANNIHVAHVEVLRAEVRVLMVGSRQVTLSVARQLDEVDDYADINPFGRVRTGARRPFAAVDFMEVIGAGWDNVLVRCTLPLLRFRCGPDVLQGCHRVLTGGEEVIDALCPRHDPTPPVMWDHHNWLTNEYPGYEVWAEWQELPLIVLAGLR